jgi:type VI secretion system protein VasI
MSTDSKATFHPQPIAFLKSMMEANTLVAQVTPYNESPVTAIFDTTGLADAIKPLRETCNW